MTRNTQHFESAQYFYQVLRQRPAAAAEIRGSETYPAIRGRMLFHQTSGGVLVSVRVTGLPAGESPCGAPVFALHIHSGGVCQGSQEAPFQDALAHYDPGGCAHPGHAGDLPPLFSNHGLAFSVFLTDRFSVEEVIGKTVILHLRPDDFTTQPSGNSGERIACGLIQQHRSRRDPCGGCGCP